MDGDGMGQAVTANPTDPNWGNPTDPNWGASAAPDFKQSDTTPNEVDPNTLGTFVKHLWAGVNPVQIGQMLPFPKAAGGSGADNPLYPQNIVKSLHAVKVQADAAMKKGEYAKALTHYVESVIPILGPAMAKMGDDAAEGRYAAAAGQATALAANVAVPKMLGGRRAPTTAVADDAATFARARGIPVDAATVTDNLAVKRAQALADQTIGGSLVATPARARQAAAMERVGGELAAEAHGVPTTPETAGTSVRKAITGKVGWHEKAANVAYDTVRQFEADPKYQMSFPTGVTGPVDALAPKVLGELRRIYHEMDAMAFSKKNFNEVPTRHGGELEVSGGAAGASVYDDILGNLSEGSRPTRSEIKAAIGEYLHGGKETAGARAALGVAEERTMLGTGKRVLINHPELPPSARDIPTHPETTRVTSQEIGLPVDVTGAKESLKPVFDQMMRQMPVTQQQANPGLKAIQNILEGPDYAPLSQVDTDLSAIKALARQRGGLAKLAVGKLESAVMRAAANGGPDVVKALQQGRAATIAKYRASEALESLHTEPVKAVRELTLPKDAAIERLRTVVEQVPEQAPVIARAVLEDLLEQPQRVASWRKLGDETKKVLFPNAGQTEALDQFFALSDRISRTNVNPSGSGHQFWIGAQGVQFGADPFHAVLTQIGAGGIAALLRYPPVVRVLTHGLSMPKTAPVAARAAVTANLIRVAQTAGVPVVLPAAAGSGPQR
jgi:hypothetical protein